MINFLKYTRLYVVISFCIIGICIFSLVKNGLSYSIDFTGGTVIEYSSDAGIKIDLIRSVYEPFYATVTSVGRGDDETYLIRSKPIDEKQEEKLRNELIQKSGIKKINTLRFETVGPSVGAETVKKTAIASALATVGILIYMTFAFKKAMHGLSAIIAMFHDLFILVGMYSLLGYFFGAEVDVLFVTAVLTSMSFSVHDTIVVFDKIREYQHTSALTLENMANKALTETMVRSINNSLTIMLMLVPLTLFGGDTIRFFSAALLIGTIVGTYSSPFVATPLLVFFERVMLRRKK